MNVAVRIFLTFWVGHMLGRIQEAAGWGLSDPAWWIYVTICGMGLGVWIIFNEHTLRRLLRQAEIRDRHQCHN